jgi:hypothetical protein
VALPEDFLTTLKYVHPKEIANFVSSENRPGGACCLTIRNEIKPIDLYCYLSARYGPPNGIQNFLRANHSNNLVHWNWSFLQGSGLIDIQGTNYRTDVWFIGPYEVDPKDTAELVAVLKSNFAEFGEGMSKCRKSLEHWVEFVNPYQRLRRSVDKMVAELRSLELDNIVELPNILDLNESEREAANNQWKSAAKKCSWGYGLCFGIRAMLPILAESFVNLLIYALMRSEIRNDKRLSDSVFRQQIDVRIKRLSIDCHGFRQPVDYANPACTKYHSVVNERNDLLHGNIDPSKSQFNEVYFYGTVPVFKEYKSMWQRSLGVEKQAVGADRVFEELATVDAFIAYVLSCIDEKIQPNIEYMLTRLELGYNTKENRLGLLFSEILVDSRAGSPPS